MSRRPLSASGKEGAGVDRPLPSAVCPGAAPWAHLEGGGCPPACLSKPCVLIQLKLWGADESGGFDAEVGWPPRGSWLFLSLAHSCTDIWGFFPSPHIHL